MDYITTIFQMVYIHDTYIIIASITLNLQWRRRLELKTEKALTSSGLPAGPSALPHEPSRPSRVVRR